MFLLLVSLEAWERYLSVNLTGVFLCYRAAAQQMLKQGHGGRIIGEWQFNFESSFASLISNISGASSAYGKRGVLTRCFIQLYERVTA
jgi:NAD(P)-dependent dehydrogenase (short-subunit alcohol dehydrogenase family)